MKVDPAVEIVEEVTVTALELEIDQGEIVVEMDKVDGLVVVDDDVDKNDEEVK